MTRLPTLQPHCRLSYHLTTNVKKREFVIQLPATVCCWTEFWYTHGSEIYCCRHSGTAVFAVRCAGCKQRYWCAVCLLGFKRTPCKKTLTWFVTMESEGSKICFRSCSHLVCFLFVVPFLKRLFVHFTLRSLCIILTSDYCKKQRHIKLPKIINNIQNPTRVLASTPSSWNTKYRDLRVLQHRAVRNSPTHTDTHHMD